MMAGLWAVAPYVVLVAMVMGAGFAMGCLIGRANVLRGDGLNAQQTRQMGLITAVMGSCSALLSLLAVTQF